MTYSVGDTVIITGHTFPHHYYDIGDICTITHLDLDRKLNPEMRCNSCKKIQFVNPSDFKLYSPSNPTGEEVKKTMTGFKVGDTVRILNCSGDTTGSHIGSIGVITRDPCCSDSHVEVSIISTGIKCCAYKVEHVSPINSVCKTMEDKFLIQLSKEQKEILSKEDQALIELGVICSDLRLSNTQYVIDFLFRQNRVEIAKQAMKDIVEIKAARKKA